MSPSRYFSQLLSKCCCPHSIPSLAAALCFRVPLQLTDEWVAEIPVQQEPFCEVLELDLEHFVLAGLKC